jgi:chromosome segregation ATPase
MIKHAEQVNKDVQVFTPEEFEPINVYFQDDVDKYEAEIEKLKDKIEELKDSKYQDKAKISILQNKLEDAEKKYRYAQNKAEIESSKTKSEKARADAAEDKLAKGIDLSDLCFYSIDNNTLDKINIMNRGMNTMNWWSDISPERLQDVYDRDGINFTEELMNENKEVVESLKYLSEIDLDKVISSKHIEDYKYKYKDGVIENIEAIKKFSDAAWSASNRIGSVEDCKIEELDKDIVKKQSQIDAITKMSGTEVSQEAANLAIKVLKYNIETSKLWNLAAIKVFAIKNVVIDNNDRVFNTLEKQLGKIKITK